MLGPRRFRSSFLWRLYAGYVTVIIVTAGLAGVLVGRRVERDTRADLRAALEAEALLLRDIAAPRLEQPPTTADPAGRGFQPHVAALGRALATRLTLIRADGRVIADSDKDPALLDNHGQRPEVLEARSRGVGVATRRSASLHTDLMYVAVPVRRDGELLGFARTALPLSAVEARIAHLWSIVAAAGLAGIAVALALGFLFARRLTRPLSELSAAASALAAGRSAAAPAARRDDEIGRLATSLGAMSQDLRERIETIERERNELRAILDSMVEGVIAVDSAERVVHINDVAAELIGSTPSASLGRSLWEVTRVLEVCEAVAAANRTGERQHGDVALAARGGDRTVAFLAAPLRDGSGRQAGAITVLHDVSEMRRLETVRRDFVANVSHELKTPLTAIRGLIETLADDSAMPAATRQRFVGKIEEQAARLSNLVTDLLAISRLESRAGTLAREPLDVGRVAQAKLEVRAQLGAAEREGLELAAEIAEQPVVVIGDQEAIGQIIDNLLDNAIQYTPAGGRIDLRVERDGDAALIEVEDTGIGIEPRHQERIFERFYREDQARSRAQGGTGLGLAIVKHTALAHGGRVAVESTPGRGSTFRVWIPLATAAGTAT